MLFYLARRLGVVLLVLLWVLPTLITSTPQELCKSLNTLRSTLHPTHRKQFLKHNFPVNYTIRVRPQEVFRLHNIRKLKAKVPDLELRHLQDLWLLVNQEVLKKILRVLPAKHPSCQYTSNLEYLLRMVQQVQHEDEKDEEERELPEEIKEIWAKLSNSDTSVWRWVTPKALMDNCFRSMHCLFGDCFLSGSEEPDYCNLFHWRKRKKQTTQKG